MDDEKALERPNAKDDLRAAARVLRAEGKNYDEIQEALGVSRSSVSLWVRDLPKPVPRHDRREQARRAAELRWEPVLKARDEERRVTKAAAAEAVGELSDRDLFLAGVALYWAEGSKDKEYQRRERVVLINSDPGVILIYLAWLELVGVEPSRIRFRVHIHESADHERARKNVGDGYHGCLDVRVLGSADLYRRIEGWWSGLVVEAKRRNP